MRPTLWSFFTITKNVLYKNSPLILSLTIFSGDDDDKVRDEQNGITIKVIHCDNIENEDLNELY